MPVEVRSYSGATADETARAFARDATDAERHGFRPTSQIWQGTTLTVVYGTTDGTGTARRSDLSIEPIALGIGGGIAAVGSVMPWIVAGSGAFGASRNGIDQVDGIFTLLVGIGLVLIGIVSAQSSARARQWAGLSILGAALVVLDGGLTLYQALTLGDYVDATLGITIARGPGLGIWLVVIGGAISFLAAIRIARWSPSR